MSSVFSLLQGVPLYYNKVFQTTKLFNEKIAFLYFFSFFSKKIWLYEIIYVTLYSKSKTKA